VDAFLENGEYAMIVEINNPVAGQTGYGGSIR
jgi:hypothetical protein